MRDVELYFEEHKGQKLTYEKVKPIDELYKD